MTVSILPNGKAQFIDINGAPLVGGKVYFFVPSTEDAKDTWQDMAGTTLNTNPIILDERGQAAIWGDGNYRQRVLDIDDNEIWDVETSAPCDCGGGAGSTAYEVGFYFIDTPAGNDLVCVWNMALDVTFGDDFAGAFGSVNTAPSGTTVFDIKRNSTVVGSLSVSSGGAVTFSSTSTSTAYTAGQQFVVKAPSGGTNGMAGLAATFPGTLA